MRSTGSHAAALHPTPTRLSVHSPPPPPPQRQRYLNWKEIYGANRSTCSATAGPRVNTWWNDRVCADSLYGWRVGGTWLERRACGVEIRPGPVPSPCEPGQPARCQHGGGAWFYQLVVITTRHSHATTPPSCMHVGRKVVRILSYHPPYFV